MKSIFYTLLITLSLTLVGCSRTEMIGPSSISNRVNIVTVSPSRTYNVPKEYLHIINDGFEVTDFQCKTLVKYHGNYVIEENK